MPLSYLDYVLIDHLCVVWYLGFGGNLCFRHWDLIGQLAIKMLIYILGIYIDLTGGDGSAIRTAAEIHEAGGREEINMFGYGHRRLLMEKMGNRGRAHEVAAEFIKAVIWTQKGKIRSIDRGPDGIL